MSPLLRKALLFGLGVASISQEKIDKFVKHLKKNKNLNEREGRRLANEMLRRSRELEKELAKIAIKNMNHFIKTNKYISKRDIDILRKIISNKRKAKKKTQRR